MSNQWCSVQLLDLFTEETPIEEKAATVVPVIRQWPNVLVEKDIKD